MHKCCRCATILLSIWWIILSDWFTQHIHYVEERRPDTVEVRGVWACSPQCFGDRRGGMERVGKTERRELPALLSMCLFSEKCSPSCTSTMPAQNDRGYCTPNHCVVGRERERSRDREKRCKVWQWWNRERARERKIVKEALQGP